MTAVARVLPGNWDGPRLLRFLAGLAMLALAFTTPAPVALEAPAPVSMAAIGETVAETSVAESSAAESSAAESSAAVSDPAPAPSVVRAGLATRPAEILVILALGSLAVLIGATPRIRGQRAPPAI